MNPRIPAALLAAALLGISAPASAGTWHSPERVPHPQLQPHVATHVVPGDPADWTYLTGSESTSPRWDPCSTITWSADPAIAATVASGIRKVAKFSGLSFRQVDDGALLTVTVVPASEFTGNTIATTTNDYTTRSDGRVWMDSVATIVSDTVLPNPRPAILHELGHAVGLGHAHTNAEVMIAGPTRSQYGAGDRAGLAAMHADRCAPPLA